MAVEERGFVVTWRESDIAIGRESDVVKSYVVMIAREIDVVNGKESGSGVVTKNESGCDDEVNGRESYGDVADGGSEGDGVADWGSDGGCEVVTGKDLRSDGVVAGRFGYHSILSDGQLDVVMEEEWGRWMRMQKTAWKRIESARTLYCLPETSTVLLSPL